MKYQCNSCAFFKAKGPGLAKLNTQILKPKGICILHAAIVATIEVDGEEALDFGCLRWVEKRQ